MLAKDSFGDLQASGERAKFDEVLKSCIAFLRGEITSLKLEAELRKSITTIFSTQRSMVPGSDDRQSNLRAVQSVIRYLVKISRTREELNAVDELTNVIVGIIQSHFGTNVPGFSTNVGFDTISELKRSYWDPCAEKATKRIGLNPAHKVIRINDIPFAESVYPALLSRGSSTLGYSILVEDVEWSDVGAVLCNNRIDVALYNGPLKQQLKLVETLFDRKLIYSSAKLIRYKYYEIIRRTPCDGKAKGKIGIPWNSDFEVISKCPKYFKRGMLHIPLKSKTVRFQVGDISYKDSADDILADVVDGKLEYGLVGGLQAHYALRQFSKRSVKGQKFRITKPGFLQNIIEDGDCKFWVSVARRDEAERLLSAMTTLWNELVVRGWEKAISGQAEELQSDLVGIVNGHRHRSYVDDFAMLKMLVEDYDDNLGNAIKYECNPVRL